MKPRNLQRKKPRVPLTSLRINSQRDLELIQKDLMLVIPSNPEIRDGDTPRCTNHPSSKAPNWTWEYKGGKSGRELSAPKIKERSDTMSTGCIFCFRNPKLCKNLLNHNSDNCRLDPAYGFKSK